VGIRVVCCADIYVNTSIYLPLHKSLKGVMLLLLLLLPCFVNIFILFLGRIHRRIFQE
jgi:hypothetical protein